MVTFSIPGDEVAEAANHGTPRPRPPLPFAKRAFAASSPYGSASAKRLGTPQQSSARKTLMTRDEMPSSSLTHGSIATARNIFRASAITDSPPSTSFSPSLPASTKKRVFAPAATPEPTRIQRESLAHATPRGVAAKATSTELFTMKIPSPPSDLTGEELTRKVPKDWNSKGSIYADQYLAHLCPAEFDDEQRRQFFCILDLRRLKYAADEIFCKKDWKLNIINFAKEFEKSRSIILLRYGLYEFQNVKPSKEVLKRWRREHGLPEPDEDTTQPTPSKPVSTSSKKRKAHDDIRESTLSGPSTNKSKRRATVQDEDTSAPLPAPVASPSKNKRKASVGDAADDQPSKLARSTSSGAKSLFEKVANNKPSAPSSATPAKSGGLFASKPTNGTPAQSVFNGFKPGNLQPGSAGSNIFGHLSDSSAKNSGVDADGESESDSDAEGEAEDSQEAEAGQSDEQSIATAPSQTGSSLFTSKPTQPTTNGISSTAAPSTRESTPGRSLFERVTKDGDGQPIRNEVQPEAPSATSTAPADQTWNPSTTPLKFAPSSGTTGSTSLFGNNAATTSSSLFSSKPSTSSTLFGAAKPDEPSSKEPAGLDKATPTADADKDGGESDKENEAQVPKKSLFETKAPTSQPAFGSSLFGAKPSTETTKEAEPAKPAFNPFTQAKTAETKEDGNATPTPASNMFGSLNKPTDTTAAAPSTVMQSSTLFGAKPAATEAKTDNEAAKPTNSLFGNSAAPSSTGGANGSTSLFGATAAPTSSNLFGGASATQSKPLFGGPAANTDASNNGANAQPASTPLFSFGGSATGSQPSATPGANPLFGGPKSPPANDSSKRMMDGSPMKQDEQSPAKRAFTGNSAAPTSTPQFSFGGQQSNGQSSNLFGGINGASGGAAPAANANAGGFNFNFGAGAPSTGGGLNNPFASANGGDKSASSGINFSFGGSSGNTNSGTPQFQFGGSNGNGAPTSNPPMFGGNTQSNSAAAPAFGGTPSFSFTGGSSQPAAGSGPVFGANTPASQAFNLQPPAGGASTTGTNSPFSLGGAGGSSLATTPAGGTPEPSAQPGTTTSNTGDAEEGEKHEQVNLTEGLEADEEVLHDVRAKVLKFVPAGEASDDEKPKSKSPWSTQGVGPLRLLKHKETDAVRLLLRAEPRGHVALNRAVLPDMSYKADAKYVRLTTSNEKGDGLETWMVQVKTQDLAKELAAALEKHKVLNKK